MSKKSKKETVVATPLVEQPKPKAAPKPKGDLVAAHAAVRELVARESARRTCLCGCGAETPRAFFVPGHDAKLMSRFLSEQTATAAAA